MAAEEMNAREPAVTVRRMVSRDIPAAARIMQTAFEAAGLPLPGGFGSVQDDADVLSQWLKREPAGAFVAEAAGDILGSVVAHHWGRMGFVGPLSVDPRWWNYGIGTELMAHCLETFDRWGCTIEKLHTYAESPRHLGFFQKCGFRPHGLSILLSKAVEPGTTSPPPREARLSGLLAGRRALVISEIREFTEEIDVGMVLDAEFHGRTLPRAEVLLVRLNRQLAAFAVCDLVDLAAVRTCHAKLIAVRPGMAPEGCLPELLHLADRFASEQGCECLMWGVGSEQMSSVLQTIAGDWTMHQRAQCMIRKIRGDAATRMNDHIFSSWS